LEILSCFLELNVYQFPNPNLIENFIMFLTAKGVWDVIATSYFDGGDNVQVYNLKRKVSQTTQRRGSLEDYYTGLQSL